MSGALWAAVAACMVTVCVSGLALVVLFRFAPRLGLLDHAGGRKRHLGAIPMIGGLAIMAGVLTGIACTSHVTRLVWIVLGTAVALVVISAIDDRRNLRVWQRVLLQSILIIGVMASTGVYVHHLGSLFGLEVNLGWFGIPFTWVAMLGLLNAFNLIDGTDGLASMLAMVALAGMALIMGSLTWGGMGSLLTLLMLAILPPLICNLGLLGARRKCFLGDAGSTLLGYLVGWSLIWYGQLPNSNLSPVGTLWCVAIPVMDTLAVMARRMSARVSPFQPDHRHIHYLLMDAGLGPRQALGVIIVAAAILWGVGTGVSHLDIGSGSNLAAFCIALFVYTCASARFETWIRTRRQPVGMPPSVLALELVVEELPALSEKSKHESAD